MNIQHKALSLAHLPPAYFGLVMATGIIAIGCHLMGLASIAELLFYLNCGQYVVLWLLYLLRLIYFPKQVLDDLSSHLIGPGYFTLVAGTGVLASQCIIQKQAFFAGQWLWFAAMLLWLIFTYSIFTLLTVKKSKPSLDQGINGGWLLAVVASQSISVCTSLMLRSHVLAHSDELNFLALCLWLWGGMLYIWMMALIFYRYYFFRFSASDLSPPYWINMGAMAISTLAGALLIGNAEHAHFLQGLLPFIKGFTVLFWATGTWWVPMLLLLGFWRHILQRFPLRYHPLYWGMVFPLGMYSVCTFEMGQALQLAFLQTFAEGFIYIALLAWGLAFIGMTHRFLDNLYRQYQGQTAAE